MAGISSYCIGCILRRQEERIREYPDEKRKADYMKELCRLIGSSKEEASAPVLVAENAVLLKKYFGIEDSYEEEKKEYNTLMLEYEEFVMDRIKRAEDPLLEALKYARTGNYIDFGALKSVEQDMLKSLLLKVEADTVDGKEYGEFKEDLSRARSLVYLTDNCGEIVLDKLFLKTIMEQYPEIHITVIVRGVPVLNDATIQDAKMVGLTDMVRVMGNGCSAAGTPLSYISGEAKKAIDDADVLLAKGQGNFESLNGCGMNIYYMFLCKCEWFVKRFHLKQFAGVFINDRHLKPLTPD